MRPIALLLWLVPYAAADQLAWISAADAHRAAAALPAGSIVVAWVSHLEDDRPVVYRVESVEVVRASDEFHELLLRGTRVAEGRPRLGVGRFEFARIEGAPTSRVVADLAYLYVRSTELRGCCVNLGKKLDLACEVRELAVELGAELLEGLQSR